jgi:hypothetical protein
LIETKVHFFPRLTTRREENKPQTEQILNPVGIIQFYEYNSPSLNSTVSPDKATIRFSNITLLPEKRTATTSKRSGGENKYCGLQQKVKDPS